MSELLSQIPSTELDAVNLMLSTIGESPIASLAESGHVDAAIAKRVLGEISSEVQGLGWHFNTDKDFVLRPSAEPPHEILTPANVARIDPSENGPETDLAMRGGKLWDRRRHSFSFAGVDRVVVDIVWVLPFDALPPPARRYVSVRAARVFQDRVVGSAGLHGFTRKDEDSALAGLRRFEAKTARRSLLSSSWSVARILARRAR